MGLQLYQKGTPTQLFSCEICDIFQNTSFEEHLGTAASVTIFQVTLREKCPYSELVWPAFSCIRTEYGKMWTRITPNTDTFYAVFITLYVIISFPEEHQNN